MKTELKVDSGSMRTVGDVEFLNPIEFPPPRGSTILLYLNTGKCYIGLWDDKDCLYWHPLLRKPKNKENK